jgi:hypothetical protein
MNRIQIQAAKLWQLLSAPDTFASYKKAALMTWDILRETLILLWLVVCLVLVVAEWFWSTSIKAGRGVRSWFNNLEGTDTNQLASETGKALLLVGKNSVDYTLSQARVQLGFPLKEPVVQTPEPVEVAAPVRTPEPPAMKRLPIPEDEE